MIKLTEHTWQNYIFYIRPMDPLTALVLLGDLQQLIIPPLADGLGEQDTDKVQSMSLQQIIASKIDIAAVCKTLSGSITGHLLLTHIKTILNPETISVAEVGIGNAVKLDKAKQIEIFGGNVLGMLKLATAVLEANYQDFFALLPAPSGDELDGSSE